MKAVFAGSFDPFTEGHLEIVKKARGMFGELVVAVAEDTGRKPAADIAKRREIAEKSLRGITGVAVKSFSGFLVDFMKFEKSAVMVRGLRDQNDFLYEQQLAEVYKSQNHEIERVYFIGGHEYRHVSGTIVRELASLGGSLDGYVAKAAQDSVRKAYRGESEGQNIN